MPEALSEPQNTSSVAGTVGFLVGACAFLLVLVTVVAGPFAPQQDLGVSLGETAGQAGKAMLRNWLGLSQPVAEARGWNIDRTLWVLSITGGGLAIILGMLAFLRGEPRRLAGAALAIGIGAVTVQLVAGAVMMILGVVLICSILFAVAAFFEGFSLF